MPVSADDTKSWILGWQATVIAVVTGVGGIATAIGKIMLYQRQVRNEYQELKEQIVPTDQDAPRTRAVIDDTATELVDVKERMNMLEGQQERNHDNNTARLDAIDDRLKSLDDDVSDIRHNIRDIRKGIDDVQTTLRAMSAHVG